MNANENKNGKAVPINALLARGERIYFIDPGDTIDSCLEELEGIKEKIDRLIVRIRILSHDEKEKKNGKNSISTRKESKC